MMRTKILFQERPKLRESILLEGLPGIGFVANILALHLIAQLKAKVLCSLRSPYFQNLAIVGEKGELYFPSATLRYVSMKNLERDLLILHGSTQPLSPYGQYEFCSTVLDVAEEFGCRLVLCAGGLPVEGVPESPKVYCAATSPILLMRLRELGIETFQGRIHGAAGLLMGLAGLRGIDGVCLLAETPGFFPDPSATMAVLKVVNAFLNLNVSCEGLEYAAKKIKEMLFERAEATERREEVGSYV
jgi:uncharacterized protein (TIGR00162 family)